MKCICTPYVDLCTFRKSNIIIIHLDKFSGERIWSVATEDDINCLGGDVISGVCFQCSPTTASIILAVIGARWDTEGTREYTPSPTCSSITRPAAHATASARVRLRSAASRTTTWRRKVRRWVDFIHITQFQLHVTSSVPIYEFTFEDR